MKFIKKRDESIPCKNAQIVKGCMGFPAIIHRKGIPLSSDGEVRASVTFSPQI